jgi:hypothetical protein
MYCENANLSLNLDVLKVNVIVNDERCHLLLPVHSLKPFELEYLNPPSSIIPHVVVDMRRGNMTAREPENIMCDSFKLLLYEAQIYGHPFLIN